MQRAENTDVYTRCAIRARPSRISTRQYQAWCTRRGVSLVCVAIAILSTKPSSKFNFQYLCMLLLYEYS